jgi:hypothetical protein
MVGNAALVVPDLVVEGIRRSRSAFEQYYALCAVEISDLRAGQADAVVRAIKEEVDGVPRSDGSRTSLGEGSSRLRVARRILKKLEASSL